MKAAPDGCHGQPGIAALLPPQRLHRHAGQLADGRCDPWQPGPRGAALGAGILGGFVSLNSSPHFGQDIVSSAMLCLPKGPPQRLAHPDQIDLSHEQSISTGAMTRLKYRTPLSRLPARSGPLTRAEDGATS